MKHKTDRRRTILNIATLAIVIAAIFINPIVGCICLLFYLGNGIYEMRKQRMEGDSFQEEDTVSGGGSIDELISLYGEPDEVIVANNSKTEGKDGVVLIYRDKGLLVINGQAIRKADIKEVMIKNENNPYLMADYQIRVVTSLEENPYLFIETGNSSVWAEDVLRQIQDELV